jgi:hypothetical protein
MAMNTTVYIARENMVQLSPDRTQRPARRPQTACFALLDELSRRRFPQTAQGRSSLDRISGFGARTVYGQEKPNRKNATWARHGTAATKATNNIYTSSFTN